MLNPKIIEFTLTGNIPSKKNSRINTSDGRSFPSNKFTQWQNDAIKDVRRQARHHFSGHVQIELILYFGTLGKADTDNKVTSILDMLVEAIVLKDDYWESVARTVYEAQYRQGKPGAFVRITELPDDWFGPEYAAAATKRSQRTAKKRLS
jgi:Holliday junction resolvase RusA-like endonuclease